MNSLNTISLSGIGVHSGTESTLSIEKNDADVWDNLGWCYYSVKKLDFVTWKASDCHFA